MNKNETYDEYKIRKGIYNEHQACIELGLDCIKSISFSFKKAKRLKEEYR